MINALIAMGHAHQHKLPTANRERSAPDNILDRLPSGVSARVSLGLISIFVGHADQNPNCALGLVRGLWFQTNAKLEYAYYKHKCQAMQHRHSILAPQRAKLQLPEDITTQALAFYNHLSPNEGQAALLSVTVNETIIKPIFNGERFIAAGGTGISHETSGMAKQIEDDDFVGWEFRRPRAGSDAPRPGNRRGFETSNTDQAQRPSLSVAQTTINWLIQRVGRNALLEHKITSRIGQVCVVSDLSHVYSSLLAMLTIRQLAAAWQRLERSTHTSRAMNLNTEINVASVIIHMAFPLREQVFIYLGSLKVARARDGRLSGGFDRLLAYVPSARELGSWEELGRIRQLGLACSVPGSPPVFTIDADALRVRIPVAYELSKLILNVTASLKAVEMLVEDLGSEGFMNVRKPSAEDPKNVPNINLNIKHMSLEAKDNPIETNLNLIWRAGMVEQETRNALEDTFEQKLQLISEDNDGNISLNDEHEHRGIEWTLTFQAYRKVWYLV